MQWIDFCCERKADPDNPPLTKVLDFLVNLHAKGLSYTTINTVWSAISAITRITLVVTHLFLGL